MSRGRETTAGRGEPRAVFSRPGALTEGGSDDMKRSREPDTWVPLLDEAEETPELTVEAIAQMTTPDELRAAWLRVQDMPLAAVNRAALEAAINSRAYALNISTWDYQPYDNGAMVAAATALQDSLGAPALVAILDDAPGKPLRIRLKGSEAAVVSLNDRVYLPEILTDAVGRLNARLRVGQGTFGEDEHPPMDVTDSTGRRRYRRTRSRAVLTPEAVSMEGNVVLVDARILEDTPHGKALAADIRAGRPVFFSTRAYGGDVREVPLTDGRVVKVPLKMELETWDRVRNPAFPDAQPVAVLDSVQMQAILDAVQAPAPSRTHIQTKKEESAVKWTKQMVSALAKTEEGRREIAMALTDSALEAEIRTAMTDALAAPTAAPAAAPAATPLPQDAIAQAVTDAMNQATEQARQRQVAADTAKAEAAAFVTERLTALRGENRYQPALLDSIEKDLAAAPDKATAETNLNSMLRMADSVMVGTHLGSLGYRGPGGAPVQYVQVGNEAKPWQPVIDKLLKEFDDWRFSSTGEKVDTALREVNKPFVQKVLGLYERLNGVALADSARQFEGGLLDSIGPVHLYNQPIIQRAILEQVFGDADMLQYLYTDVFEGDELRIPVEYFEAPDSLELNTDDSTAPAEALIRTAWLSFSPVPRRVRVEIDESTQLGMASGPLRYNAAARALYHAAAHHRRILNRAAGNEMLRASDAYKSQAVTETLAAGAIAAVADAGNVAYKLTLTKGGNAAAPVVRPRRYKSTAANGAVTDVAENSVTVTADGTPLTEGYLLTKGAVNYVVNAAGNPIGNAFAVDYENGFIYVSDGPNLVGDDVTVTYSYATNFRAFSLTVPNGVDEDRYFSRLLWTVDDMAAEMGSAPRFVAPNFALGSQTAMTKPTRSDLFYKERSPNGTVLNSGTGNFIASRNGVDYAKHNTQWQGGDRRILLGRVGASKYAVRDPFRQEGPYPSYDSQGRVIPKKQWLTQEFSTLITPEVRDQAGETLNPYYMTIILTA